MTVEWNDDEDVTEPEAWLRETGRAAVS